MARTRFTLTFETDLFPPAQAAPNQRPAAPVGQSLRPWTPPPQSVQPIPDMSGTAADLARWTRGLTRAGELLAPTLARHVGRLGDGHVARAEQLARRVKPIAGALTLPHAFAGLGGGSALARGTSAFKFARSYVDVVPGAEAIMKGSQRFGPLAGAGFKALGPIGSGLDLARGHQGGGFLKVAERVGFNALGGASLGPEGALVAAGLTLAQELGTSRRHDSLADMRRYYRRGYVSPFMPFVRPERPPTRAQLHRAMLQRGSAVAGSIAYGLEHGPGFLNNGLGLPPAEIARQARSQLVGMRAPVRLSAAQGLIEWTRVQQAAGHLWPGTTSGVMAQLQQAMPRLGGFLRRRGEGSPWQLTRTLEGRTTARDAAGQVGAVANAHASFGWALGRSGGDLRQRWLETMNYLGYQTKRGTANARRIARDELGQLTSLVKDRGQQVANWLAKPFTEPLARSIHQAGSLSRQNVAAVIVQLRRLSPQMRTVTTAALRDQVATMERHRQVLTGTTRALVAGINGQWPKMGPASRRAVTQAISRMSARMVDGRHVLNPQAVKLADGIRSAMQGPFGGIVRDFGSVVSGLVSTASSAGSAISSGSTGSLVSLAAHRPSPSSPPPTYRRQAAKFRHALGLDGSSPLHARRGGRIAALVSPGELIVHGDRSWKVPGAHAAADNVLTMLPLGASVLTGHGQALLAAGMGLDGALAHQLPHFGRGGKAGKAEHAAARASERAARRANDREVDAYMRSVSAQAREAFESDTGTPGDIAAVLGSQRGRRSGLFAALDLMRRRGDRSGARAIKAQIAAGRQAYQQRQYDQRDAELALDDLALSADPDNAQLRAAKLQHLEGYRSLLSADLDRARRTNNYAAISDLAARLQAVGESIRDLTEATEAQRRIAEQRMELDRELAENQRRMLAVAESQPNVLLGGLIAAVNGGIGGRVGLGFQTPSYAGRGVRY